jgi:protein arginine N-methyltransferase 1
VTRFAGYSVAGYGRMIADEVRIRAYSRALERTIVPGSIVLDIGAGTGILSLLACKYGAGKVYAVEPSIAIVLAEEHARANGFAGRIEFIQRPSTQIDLPQRADVIVSDLRGVLPLFEHNVPSLVDARRRLLARGGKLIPSRDRLWAAVVEAPQVYDDFIQPWQKLDLELNLDAARDMVKNLWKRERVSPDGILTSALQWGALDYMTVESPDLSAELDFDVQRAGTAHGFVAWFDCELADGVGFSTAPHEPRSVYGSAFFPFTTPVPLSIADRVKLRLRANLVGEDYVWTWTTEMLSGRGQRVAQFSQSTFHGTPVSRVQLRKRSARYKPMLNATGEVDAYILASMDGSRSSEAISRLVMARFPSEFPTIQKALTRVADLIENYSD